MQNHLIRPHWLNAPLCGASLLSILACSGLTGGKSAPPPGPAPVVAPLPGGPTETLSLARARWGVPMPNSLKRMAVAWDGQHVQVAGGESDVLLAVDPSVGRPVSSLSLAAPGFHTPEIHADIPRQRLWWVDLPDGKVRSVDLKTGKVDTTCDPQATEARHGIYVVRGAAIDAATGWLWVASLDAGLSGYAPGSCTPTRVAGVVDAVGIAADPRGDSLYVVTGGKGGGQGGGQRGGQGEGGQGQRGQGQGGQGQGGRAGGGAMPTGADKPPLDGTRPARPAGGGRPARGAEGGGQGAKPPGGQEQAGAAPTQLRRYQPSTGALTDVVMPMPPGGKQPPPPKGLVVDPSGRVYLLGNVIVAIGDGGSPRWIFRPQAGAVTGYWAGPGGLYVVTGDRSTAQVQALSWETGQAMWSTPTRYQAAWVDGNATTVFVGNGGDASVTELDAGTGAVRRTLDVGNSAEASVVDARTGTRYILDRLGGGQIHVWQPNTATVVDWTADGWPMDLAVDSDRRVLMALSYFRSELMRWNLDTGAPLPAIALGAPMNVSETLGDLAYSTGGLAAAIFPETGWVSLADSNGTLRWAREVPALKSGINMSAGHGAVAIDEAHGMVYALGGKPEVLYALSIADGSVVTQVQLSEDRRKGYLLNRMFYDTVGSRVFVGASVYVAPTLVAQPPLADPLKVLWSDATRIYAQRVADTGAETLVRLDARTLAEQATLSIGNSTTMRLEATIVPATNQVIVSDMTLAEVRVYTLP